MANFSPTEVDTYLSGINYPATKQDLLDEADAQAAREDFRAALAQIPDEQYDSPTAVSEALAQVD
ncbi:MAG: DUF2795 domain-containing protein [Chloroflexota bacterium]|nr:DUF2795 domain-containing protein [Chloroflexota bacterium]